MTKVLFIAGYGRSGSTLLEHVLAKDEAFVPLGEVKHLWLQGYVMNFLCACGTPFQECPFWREIDQAAFEGLAPDAARKLFDLRRTRLKASRVPSLLADAWRARRGRPVRGGAVDQYARHVRAVYEAALASSPGSILIDSSKDPLHGLAMARLGRDDVALHVVHLVRDARGVAFSMLRPKRRRQVHWKEQYTKVRSPLRSALVWSYRNLLAATLRPLAASYRLVRYEDFVSDPDRVVAAIRDDVGLPAAEPVLRDGRRVLLAQTHSVSGNPNRFEGRDVALRLDDAWRSGLPRTERLAVTALASPLLLRYGYLSGGPRTPARASGG